MADNKSKGSHLENCPNCRRNFFYRGKWALKLDVRCPKCKKLGFGPVGDCEGRELCVPCFFDHALECESCDVQDYVMDTLGLLKVVYGDQFEYLKFDTKC